MWFLSPEFPQKDALVIHEHSISFAELQSQIQKVSQQIKPLSSAILVLKASPSIEFISQFLAALYNNQPVALLPSVLSEEELQTRLDLLGHWVMIDHQGQAIASSETSSLAHPHLALVLFTSGTTGQIKGVQLSLQNIMANCQAVINAMNFQRYQDQLLFLPLSYSFGLLGQLLPGLMSGLTTHLLTNFTDIKARFDTQQIPELWSGVPSHLLAICKMGSLFPDEAKKIHAIVSAGAPLPLSLRRELTNTFTNAIIYNNYGLTEASPRVLTYSSIDPLFYEDFAGYPIGDWQVKLSEEGELLIQGKQIMLGYLGEAFNSRLVSDKKELRTSIPSSALRAPSPHVWGEGKNRAGWLATGDLAAILANGLIAIKGRCDHLINVGGERINVLDIEKKISQLPGINEVLVVTIEDALYGVRLMACCDIDSHALPCAEKELTTIITKHLLPKKLPIRARSWSPLPRNANGKLDKKELIKLINEEVCI